MRLKKYSIITWLLLTSVLVTMLYRITILENKLNSITYNQNLILMQLEESENNINNINKEVSYIDSLIDKYAKQLGVDKNLCHAVAIVESNKKQNVISSANSIGIYQLQPSTAKSLGVNPYDIEQNIKGGVTYLKHLQDKFNGNTDLVIAGYNAGPNAVRKHNGIPPYKETQKYVQKVKKEKEKLDNK